MVGIATAGRSVNGKSVNGPGWNGSTVNGPAYNGGMVNGQYGNRARANGFGQGTRLEMISGLELRGAEVRGGRSSSDASPRCAWDPLLALRADARVV